MKKNPALQPLVKLANLVDDKNILLLTNVEHDLAARYVVSCIPEPNQDEHRYLTLTSLPWVLDSKLPKVRIEEFWDIKPPSFGVDVLTVPNGNLRPTFMVVGIAPGEGPSPDTGRHHRAWVFGPSSRLLRSSLDLVGIHDRCFFTNVMKYSLPGNRNPNKAEVAEHMPLLRRELEILRPDQVIVLGRAAAEYLAEEGVDFTFVRHPSWFLRTGRKPYDYAEHINQSLNHKI